MTTRSRSAAPKRDPKTGKWGFVVDLPAGPNGERRQARRRGFASKREADEALARMQVASKEGTYVAPTNQTVGEFLLDEWLPAVRMSLEPSTWKSYDSAIRLRVLPTLGGLRLRALSPGHLNVLYAQLLEDGRHDQRSGGLSARSVRYTHTILSRAMRDAVRWQRIALSPVAAADPPRAKDARPPEMQTWSAAEVSTFLEAEKSTRYWIGWRLLVTTGLRRGEALGLRWSDLDLDEGRLAVRQQLRVDDHELVFISHTKTDRPRVIHLDAATVAALRATRKDQLEERMLHGAGYADHDLVLCRPDGRPYHPERFSQEFKRRIKRHGMRRIRLHDLRHTWATLALAGGIHPKVVQEHLGHASIVTTLNTYSHVIPSMKSEAAETVAGMLGGGA